jgi:SAM-dependent MidA family methyltransferase
MSEVADRLRHQIAVSGPITVAQYMTEANAHYYATRDPLGAAGDFTTAPEISQMFGELVGLALADAWARAGRPDPVHYVELGPGRGSLAADALRAMRAAGLRPRVELVETSPALRAAQAQRVGGATWHDDVSTLPEDAPLLVVANEFFDALPIHQLVRAEDGWRELMVTWEEGRFRRIAGPPRPAPFEAEVGTIVEASPASLAIASALARRLVAQGGLALVVDYGPERSAVGDTLQSVARHAFADPWTEPGERDLTAHVSFELLARSASAEGVQIFGPSGQGAWLEALGIGHRAAALAAIAPHRGEEFAAARARLVDPGQMGTLFKVMAWASPGWPAPEGLA